MEQVAPAGPVYQAGTLAGNPLAVAAGCAALRLLSDPAARVFDRLERSSEELASGLRDRASHHGVPLRVERVGSMVGLFFSDPARPIECLADVAAGDHETFRRVFHVMLREGVHLPPSAYEALFVSTAHGEEEIEKTLAAFDKALAEAKR